MSRIAICGDFSDVTAGDLSLLFSSSAAVMEGTQMRVFDIAILFAALDLGCGGSASHQSEDSDPGGSIGPIHVAIRTGQPPALIAFVDQSGAQWQTPAIGGGSEFDVVTTGPYRVVVVCNPALGETDVREFARMPQDDRMLEAECPSYPFIASGLVEQPGAVFLGNLGQGSNGAPWNFDLPASAGTFDLVMLSGDTLPAFDGIAVRRGVAITGDTQLGSIDLAQESVHPLIEAPVVPLNYEPGERMFSDTTLHAGATIARVDESLIQRQPMWLPRFAPDGVVQAGDHQVLSLSTLMAISQGAISQLRFRSVSRETPIGAASSASLPEPLGSVRFELSADRLSASWESLPEHDQVTLERESSSLDGSIVFHEAALSAAYVSALGTTTAVLDFSDIPGFQAAWRHDPAAVQLIGLFTDRRTSPYESASSGISEQINEGPARAIAEPGDGPSRLPARDGHLYRIARRAAAIAN